MGKQFSSDLKMKAVKYYHKVDNYSKVCKIFECINSVTSSCREGLFKHHSTNLPIFDNPNNFLLGM